MIKEKPGEKTPVCENSALIACLEVGKILASALNLQEILDLIMIKVSESIEAQNWSLLMRDEMTGELPFDIVVGIKKDLLRGIRLAPGEGVAGHVAQTGNPLILPDVQDRPEFAPKVDALSGFGTRSIICVPLQIHGKILGVIEILNVRDMTMFESRYLPVLLILADYAAIAIENSRLFAKITRMSITDEYTGLYNARYLHQFLDGLICDKPSPDAGFAVVFVDIDNFKGVVDKYGHLLGTRILREIGQTISSCLSIQDRLVKYGGDEYIIILPARDRQAALELCNHILDAVRTATYLISETPPAKITASFGIAMYPEDARMKKDVLILADQAMYRVKRSTKNRIGIHDNRHLCSQHKSVI